MSQYTPQKEQVLKNASAMGAATFLSRVMGLVREQVFAYLFGAGNATDAFNIAFRIPNLLRDLFAEGAMSATLVPNFTEVRAKEGDRRAWRIAGLAFRVLLGLVGLITVIGMIFSQQLVGLYASAFQKIPGKFELTVQMTQILFPFFPLVALAAAFMGILNACGVFFIPAFASALFNVGSVITGVFFTLLFTYTGWEQPIIGMAIGVVLGGAVQAFSQLPALRRQGYRFPKKQESDAPWHQEPVLKRMLLMMIPGTVGLAATQVNVLINSVLATSQGPGAVSWLQYAFRLMQFPIGIFGVSLAAATLPAVSRQWVNRDAKGVSQTLTRSLLHVFAINFPASCGLAFLGVPIIQLLFEYGRFNATDTASTAQALAAYAVGLTFYSAVKVLVPVCYALGKTRIAVISSALSVGFTICFNLAMIGRLGYVGLALGTSFAAVLNAAFLIYSVQRILKEGGGAGLDLVHLFKKAMLHLAVAVLMGSVAWLFYRQLGVWVTESEFIVFFGETFGSTLGNLSIVVTRVLRLAVLMGLAIGVWMGAAHLLKLTEVTEATELFLRKLKNKVSRSKK